MANVFISYSRRDIAFASLLNQGLEEQGFTTWVDWQDIPPSTEWLKEIFAAIEQADVFLYVLSNKSINSETCKMEFYHALANNKRIIPVSIDDLKPENLFEEIAAINWISFQERKDYKKQLQDLLTAINIDFDWIKSHTRLQVRALEWTRKGRNQSFLLRGNELAESKDWLARKATKEPHPTILQEEYVASSIKTANRRKQLTIAGLATVLFTIVISISIFLSAQTDLSKQEEEAQLFIELLQAVRLNDPETVKVTLEWGADVNKLSDSGDTLLHEAVAKGHLQVTELLLNSGATVDVLNDRDLSPLYLAVENGHLEIAALLLEYGADVDTTDQSGLTPLYIAIHMIDIYLVSDDVDSAGIVALLLESGASIDVIDESENTLLHKAVGTGNTEIVDLLLKAGANPNATNDAGSTPFFSALLKDQDMIFLLLDAGLDVNADLGSGSSYLKWAALFGNAEAVSLLIQFEADPNLCDNDEITPLHWAVLSNSTEVVEVLLKAGANVNMRDSAGRTPLSLAREAEYIELIEILKQNGAVE